MWGVGACAALGEIQAVKGRLRCPWLIVSCRGGGGVEEERGRLRRPW